jgi:ubiquitin C-terminal hydrolase
MINILEDLPKEIIDSKIDIDALNEFFQQEENGKNIMIDKNGQIICEDKNKKWYNFFIDWITKILKIVKILPSYEEKEICGIINIGNNCYLNAGLQILSRCYPLLKELLKSNFEKDELMKLLVESMITLLFKKDKYYNPTKFIKCFCKRNKEFIVGQQNCSQDFIRTVLRNINETYEKKLRYEDYYPNNAKEFNAYKTYIIENKIFPESKPYSIFNGILKIEVSGMCTNCKTKINDYSFSNFVDQHIYLDSFTTKCRFSDVLRKNIGKENKASMNCPKCKEKIRLKSVSKFVKIPDIFIFTLERYLIRNKVPIEPDDFINIDDLVDKSLHIDHNNCVYELFAINIRIGDDISFGHEICQIKQKDKWYTIDDGDSYERQKQFNEYSYGLFYRKILLK